MKINGSLKSISQNQVNFVEICICYRVNVFYLSCLIFYDMSEKIDESEQAQEKKAIPREPTEVSGAKESKGT
jgi:hypothetical protein